MSLTLDLTCAWCGTAFQYTYGGRGGLPLYCKPSHRTRANEVQRHAPQTPPGFAELQRTTRRANQLSAAITRALVALGEGDEERARQILIKAKEDDEGAT